MFIQVQLRHKFAKLLGYTNYADFAIEPRMPRTSRKVCAFLLGNLLDYFVLAKSAW